jgi:hypothetical protein
MSAVALNILRRSPRFCASSRNKWPVRLYNEQSPVPPLGGIEPPLRGLRVVDLTRVLAGPTATMLLADLGADVIKVEEITRGDDTSSVFRSFHPAPHSPQYLSGSWNPPAAPLLDSAPASASHLPPESAYFLSINRNKRSITVDFKTPAGLEILHRLIKQSDIFIENFISGKLATIGLGWDDCRKINPRLIYASITGTHAFEISPKTPHSPQYRRVWSDGPVQEGCRIRCSYRRGRYAYVCTWDPPIVTYLVTPAGLMHM